MSQFRRWLPQKRSSAVSGLMPFLRVRDIGWIDRTEVQVKTDLSFRANAVIWVRSLAVLATLCGLQSFGSITHAQDAVEQATHRLRELYWLRDFPTGVKEGRFWCKRAPENYELRAWYVQNMASNRAADSAVVEARRMVEADSTNAWSWFALAGALNWGGGHSAEALEASERALALAPDNLDFLHLRAESLVRNESNEAAISYVDGLPPEIGQHPMMQLRKAVAIYMQSSEDRDEALAEQAFALFEHIREIDPSNLSAHFLHGSYLGNRRRISEALPLLRRSAELSHGAEVHQYYWRTVLGQRDVGPEEKRAEIEADIASMLELRGDSPDVLLAISSAYEQLQLEGKQQEVEQRIIGEYAETQAAEWALVNRYRRLRRALSESRDSTGREDPEMRAEYRLALVSFLERPAFHQATLRGDAYRQLFWLLREDDDVDPDYLYEVVDGMAKYEGINLHIIHGQGPITLAEHNTHFREAEELARDGLAKATEYADEQKEYGRFDTDGEYEEYVNRMHAIMYDAIGWVYFNEGRLEEAEEELLRAYNLDHENITNLYHLGRLYEKKYDRASEAGEADAQLLGSLLDSAEEYYIKGVMVQRPGTNPNDDALKELYEKRTASTEGFEDYLADASNIDRERRREKTLAERIEAPEPVEPFTLTDINGVTVSSEDLKGRIVAVNFWGTWCGPCVVEMPEFQKFHEQYRDDAGVVVLTINNDPNPDDVPPWMAEHEYDFTVLVDDGYASSAGVYVYPTSWFLDAEGRLVFIKEGWSESLAEEFGWRVEALRVQR